MKHTLRHILFFSIEAVTSSSFELNTGLISEKKNVSKSTGTFAAFNDKNSNNNHNNNKTGSLDGMTIAKRRKKKK